MSAEMKNTLVESKLLRDGYRCVKHASGLTVFIYPKAEMRSTYAVFGTRYGSIDKVFKRSDEDKAETTPAGIAHFLEHKLFESEDGDAFGRYAEIGASANAYTSFETTRYLFSCTENAEQALEILLDFVQSPYFTKQTVEKELGIIGQEIKMYDDDPQWRMMFSLLRAMYHTHPIKDDIAGTVESIAEITPEYLYRCYNTFYNLNNMVIAVAGNFDVDKTLEICDELLKPSKDHGLQVIVPDEPLTVHEKRNVQKLSCAIPLFNIGWKFPAYSGKEQLEKYIVYNILMELCLGRTSDFYNRMYEDGLLNDAFNVGVFCGRGFFSVIADGESTDPDKVLSEIEKELFRLRKEGLDEDEFITIRNKTYGELVAGFNNVESVANAMISQEINDVGIYDGIEITANTTFADIKSALDDFDIENNSISIIEPADEN